MTQGRTEARQIGCIGHLRFTRLAGITENTPSTRRHYLYIFTPNMGWEIQKYTLQSSGVNSSLVGRIMRLPTRTGLFFIGPWLPLGDSSSGVDQVSPSSFDTVRIPRQLFQFPLCLKNSVIELSELRNNTGFQHGAGLSWVIVAEAATRGAAHLPSFNFDTQILTSSAPSRVPAK